MWSIHSLSFSTYFFLRRSSFSFGKRQKRKEKDWILSSVAWYLRNETDALRVENPRQWIILVVLLSDLVALFKKNTQQTVAGVQTQSNSLKRIKSQLFCCFYWLSSAIKKSPSTSPDGLCFWNELQLKIITCLLSVEKRKSAYGCWKEMKCIEIVDCEMTTSHIN